jgi:hypothetical protein
MLSEKELEVVNFGIKNGKTPDEIKKALAEYRAVSGWKPEEEQTTAEPGTFDGTQGRLADVGNQTAQTISDNITGSGQYAGQTPLRRGVQATAAAFSSVPKGALAMAPEPVRKGVEYVSDKIGQGFNALTNKIGSTKFMQEAAGSTYTDPVTGASTYTPNDLGVLEEGLGIAASGGEIAGNILGARGVVQGGQIVSNATKTAAGATSVFLNDAASATSKLVSNATGLVKRTVSTPEKTIPATVGEVLQGKPKDVALGIKAFKEIDTDGVETYAELGNRIDDSIRRLSQVVDDELAVDVTKTKLSDLTTTLTTQSGKTVSTNYVDTALKQMKELYEKTGDVQKAADIDELIARAETEGLTRLDVNNISRVYNTEFGSKAFNQMGEPLTSVNAQFYETVRKGLKGKARDGIGGAAAKEADEAISALYNTKTLVQKNIDAVNRLQQKISERGTFEKAGYYLSKYADILTGGSVRGFVGGILPRGAGYKTMNALDLETRLQKNLEIIKRASEATDDAEMAKILSEMETD